MVKQSRQELRSDFITKLLAKDRGTVMDAMLVADAIVRFVETGEIIGLSPAEEDGLRQDAAELRPDAPEDPVDLPGPKRPQNHK
jgi:hypothetical protein